jgi:hypothetical protein
MRRSERAKGRGPVRRPADGVHSGRRTRERDEAREPDDWAVDVAGELELEGHRLLVPNRAGQKIRAPLRLS